MSFARSGATASGAGQQVADLVLAGDAAEDERETGAQGPRERAVGGRPVADHGRDRSDPLGDQPPHGRVGLPATSGVAPEA